MPLDADEGATELARLTNQQQTTHEQIIGAIGRLEGLVEAEGEARREFRATFVSRLEGIERKQGEAALQLHKLETRFDGNGSGRPETGVVLALIRMFERQPLLAAVVAGTVLALGSGGVVAIWEAVRQ